MILHIMILDKFLAPFIDFIDKNFGRTDHKYVFINNEEYKFGLEKRHDVEFLNSDEEISIILKEYMYKARKIILHGLWRDRVDNILYHNQILLKKCYWIMWGGDFYFPEEKSKIKHEVIKNIEYLLTGTRGDYELVQYWYGAKGKYIKCFNYPSNIYKEIDVQYQKKDTINIQVGNSADLSNNHLQVFNKLLKYKDENIKIYCPLSYPYSKKYQNYANEVIRKGNELFGNKFVFFKDFIGYTEYLEILSNIDIAIFNHKRQQAFGNIITLLGLGKKVYINKESTLNNLFNEIDVKTFNFEYFNLSLLEKDLKNKNIENVKEFYSEKQLIHSLKQYIR